MKVLVIFEIGMFWIRLKLCACYLQNYQVMTETYVLEMSWPYAENTRENQI